MRRSRGRIVFAVLALVGMLAFAGLHAPVASAQESDDCPLVETIPSLQACVQHAADIGLIDNQGVTRSLLAKLDAAQAAVERDQPGVAVRVIRAFEREVSAQAGKHIEAEHAEHMLMHAEMVIEALRGS